MLGLIWIRPLVVIGNIGLYLFENLGKWFVFSINNWISIQYNIQRNPITLLFPASLRPHPLLSNTSPLSPLLSLSSAFSAPLISAAKNIICRQGKIIFIVYYWFSFANITSHSATHTTPPYAQIHCDSTLPHT